MTLRSAARTILIPVVSIALAFAIWDILIRVFQVDPFVAPSPGEALGALRDNWSTLWPLALETIRETVYGFIVGAVLGFSLAVVMAQAVSQLMPYTSINSRISSATAIAGWVSFICTANLRWN